MKPIILALSVYALTACATTGASRQSYIDSHPFLSSQARRCILEKKICLGMTPDDVVASWGRPTDINRSVGTWGRHEQWVYGSSGHRTYVYFENGTVTSWQN